MLYRVLVTRAFGASILLVMVTTVPADTKSTSKNWGLYTDQTTCFRCDGSNPLDGNVVDLPVYPLTPAAAGTDVSVTIKSFSDLRTTSRWLEVYMGGIRVTPSIVGSTNVPANGEFWRDNGTNSCTCCSPNNTRTFTVPADWFNQRLSGGQMTVQYRIPPGVDVDCMAIGCNNCASFPYQGQQIVTITWTPAPACVPSECPQGNDCQYGDCVGGSCVLLNEASGTACGSDENPCTSDVCNGSGSCTHPSNADACSDGLYCNGSDTCSGGICSLHGGNPCGGSVPVCCESTDACVAQCCDSAACGDGSVCTGTESCVSGECQAGTPLVCNDNNPCTDDWCDAVTGCAYVIDDTNFCSDGLVCNGLETCVGGTCLPGAPPVAAPQSEPSGVSKDRYISFIPLNAGANTAIRVELTSLHHPPSPAPPGTPSFTDFEGQYRYVNGLRDGNNDPIFSCPDSALLVTSFKCAKLGCEPEYRDWAGELAGGVLHLTGAEVIPSSEYQVAQLAQSCQGQEETCAGVSCDLTVDTGRWGDVDADGQVNVFDVNKIVDKILDLATGTSPKPQAQIQPNVPNPSASVNVLDVANAVDAVKGKAYPFTGPCECASTPRCNATTGCDDCTSPRRCVNGSCMTLDPCERCEP